MGGREKCKQISCYFIIGEIMMKNIITLEVLNQNQALRIRCHPKKKKKHTKNKARKLANNTESPKSVKKKKFFLITILSSNSKTSRTLPQSALIK